MNRRKKAQGFTIIELLVVIVVLALIIIMSVSVGKSAIQRSGFTSGVNQFVADYNYARQLAARQNRYVAFQFNAAAGSYNILVQRASHVDLSNPNSYTHHKTNAPLEGEAFFTASNDFAVNSMGIIRQYPVNVNAQPINIRINFFKKSAGGAGGTEYTRDLIIYPYGGIRLTDPVKVPD